jgi:hypothetical protein
MQSVTNEPARPSVGLEMAKQILEQGERYMTAQLQCALASDQRATTTANTLVAAATAVLGAGAAYYGATADLPVLLGALTAGILLAVAAGFNIHAARPTEFYCPGNYPSQWWPHATGDFALMVAGEAENYDERIRFNSQILDANGKWQRRGSYLGVAAPVAGVITWILASLPWSQVASLLVSPSP